MGAGPVVVLPGLPPVVSLLARAALTRGRPGAAGGLPARTVTVLDHAQDAVRLAAYDRLCGFGLADRVPATWLHVLTFPLQAHLLAGRDFPFPTAGLVHLRNELTLHRPVLLADRLRLAVRVENLADHRRGHTFEVVGTVHVGDELAWTGRSTYLAREARPAESGRGDAPAAGPAADGPAVGPAVGPAADAAAAYPHPPLPPVSQRWRLPADLGRRYSAVAGDVNPLHLYPLTARPFGFRRAIVQGMWTHARALAALGGRLGPTHTVAVTFTRPILLPGTVTFGVRESDGVAQPGGVRERGGGVRFAVMDADGSRPHLLGEAR